MTECSRATLASADCARFSPCDFGTAHFPDRNAFHSCETGWFWARSLLWGRSWTDRGRALIGWLTDSRRISGSDWTRLPCDSLVLRSSGSLMRLWGGGGGRGHHSPDNGLNRKWRLIPQRKLLTSSGGECFSERWSVTQPGPSAAAAPQGGAAPPTPPIDPGHRPGTAIAAEPGSVC